jgi:hypothetical protein
VPDLLPSLLIHPHPYRTEGPRGYLLRLASENQLSLADIGNNGIHYSEESLKTHGLLPIEALDPGLFESIRRLAFLWDKKKGIWNHRFARFCPLCLADEAYWRAGWEVYFHDACPTHEMWLVDQCSSCGKTIPWNRKSLLRCNCGADLRLEVARECPVEVASLSKVIAAKLMGESLESLPVPLKNTDVTQTLQVLRFLGTGFSADSAKKPLKILDSGTLAVSWNITTRAAGLFSNWPTTFHLALDQLQDSAGDTRGHALKSAFGRTYEYLFRGLKGSAFTPLQDAFGEWLGDHWKGDFAKRNRRLVQKMMKHTAWTPTKLACDALGISTKRLDHLIREQVIESVEFFGQSGRRFCMVRYDQLPFAKEVLASSVTLTDACEMLGLSKKRMRNTLKLLFPNARKRDDKFSTEWSIQRSEVEVILDLGEGLPLSSIPDEGCVSINHILRYWAWSNEDVVGLLYAARNREVLPVARVEGGKGVSGLVFDGLALKLWYEQHATGKKQWFSCPQFASDYSISEEAVYYLVVQGFIEAEHLPSTRYGRWRISREAIERFFSEYVFASELAVRAGVASISIRRLLDDQGILAVSGPGVDGGKKILYRRTPQIERIVSEFNGRRPDSFSLTSPLGHSVKVGKSETMGRGIKQSPSGSQKPADI